MVRMLFSRLAALVPVVFGVSVVVFLMLHLSPGDPAVLAAGMEASEADIQNVRQSLGLDRSLPVQYVEFVQRAVTGDFGSSFRTHRPVMQEIAPRYVATLQLTLAAMAFAVVIGIGLGIVTATFEMKWLDSLSEFLAILGLSVPGFFLGLIMMLLFSVYLGWLPLSGNDSWSSVILPAITLGVSNAAIVSRVTQASLTEVLRMDYVRTAKAKGVRRSVIVWRHALRNALMPVVTVVGLQSGYLLGGAVVVETVFAWPGIGRLIVQSIAGRDFPVIQASVLLVSLTFVAINLLTDLLYGVIDPRVVQK
ncbi:ABC transporter permease [Rhizobium puerariae]|uniref:Glutathione transport system permease protein GsiC n=1 Tax=Rhizobium puerariae TaxID=1585791 RepID=A0ABV6AMW2_9HYPH